ncbi:MAG: glycosyltransferase family 9 protein [Trueperaceae bacterium]
MSRNTQHIPGVERIAVLRANGIGDLMFALPALEALRGAYPAAKITLLATPWHKALIEGRPGPVDEVVTVPIWRGVREEAGVAEEAATIDAFFEEMQGRRFDLALQLHGGGGNSNRFVSRLGARVSAGLRAPGAPALDLNVPYVYYQSEVMRLLEVASSVGAVPVSLEPSLALTSADRSEAEAVLPADGRPVALLNPGASDPRRRWPASKFAVVGDELAKVGARVAVIGGPDDEALGDDLVQCMHEPADYLVGRLSLGGLAGLLGRCRLLVSNDSGPLHLAAAVGAATVGIYWCGNLINAGPAFRTRHRPLLAWRLECPVCGLDCTRTSCNHDASFVADIPESEVVEAALEHMRSTGATDD